MKFWGILFILLIAATMAQAEIVTKAVEYKHDDVLLEGYLAYDDAREGKRPGVLVIHEWWGLNDYAKMRARQLAEMGYVAFAVDMYGKGIVTNDPQEAGQFAGQVRGTPLMGERAKVGLDVLLQQEQVDPERIAAIGFCFGGTGVLELAYIGADIDGVVSFHGGLSLPQEDAEIKAKILVLHGAVDPHVPKEEVDAFQDAMTNSGADWQFIAYSDAVHSFSNPNSGNDPSTGAAYDAKAARRSWQHMKLFFDELFLGR